MSPAIHSYQLIVAYTVWEIWFNIGLGSVLLPDSNIWNSDDLSWCVNKYIYSWEAMGLHITMDNWNKLTSKELIGVNIVIGVVFIDISLFPYWNCPILLNNRQTETHV